MLLKTENAYRYAYQYTINLSLDTHLLTPMASPISICGQKGDLHKYSSPQGCLGCQLDREDTSDAEEDLSSRPKTIKIDVLPHSLDYVILGLGHSSKLHSPSVRENFLKECRYADIQPLFTYDIAWSDGMKIFHGRDSDEACKIFAALDASVDTNVLVCKIRSTFDAFRLLDIVRAKGGFVVSGVEGVKILKISFQMDS